MTDQNGGNGFQAQFHTLARTILDKAPSNCLGPGAAAAQILETELALGVRLPASYKCFLAEFGWAAWPEEIAGVTSMPTGYENVDERARLEREDAEPEMRRHLVPFYNDGWGNHYCLDTSRFEGDECPVVFWNQELEAEQAPVVVCGSFVEWLVGMAKEMLEWEREGRLEG